VTSAAGWTELAISASQADLETVAELLAEYAPGAVWIEPAIVTSDHRDFAYTVLDEGGTVRAAVPDWGVRERSALEARLAALALARPPGPLVERAIGEHDWAEEWKRFYHVMHVGPSLVVRPSWEDYQPASGEVVIVLDPGAAFGTGQHASTQLCLAALQAETTAGMRVLDLGCGSGILAIAAALLGAAEVLAVDLDPQAHTATEANAAANGVADRVRSAAGSLGDAWPWPSDPPLAAFDLVVANISAAVLSTLLPEVAAALRPGAVLIAAGFIDGGSSGVRDAASRVELTPLRDETLEDDSGNRWQCLVASRAALTPES
jgi:ribosomal protein L11 methyltransferase